MRAARAALLSLLLLTACAPEPGLPPGPDDPSENLARYDAFLARVERDGLGLSWELLSGDRPATSAGLDPESREEQQSVLRFFC